MGLLELITQPLSRVGSTAQNAIEIARFGGLETAERSSPYDVVTEHAVHRLRHYFPEQGGGSAVLLVPPLMLAADVYDVNVDSGVRALRQRGIDPWVVDFGRPEREPLGLERRLEDHVLAVSQAIDDVVQATNAPVHVAGYSQGGMFAYQAAAYRQNEGIGSLIAFGSAVDTHAAAPFGLPPALLDRVASLLSDGPLSGATVPAWASRTAFLLMDPRKTIRQRIDFLMRLHDREALLPRERQRRFLASEGYVAWPGPAVADLMREVVRANRMLRGGLVVDGRLVTLADITVPILSVVGTMDEFSPPLAVRGITRAAPRSETYELEVPTGHFGLVVGTSAAITVWPTVSQWVQWQSGASRRPAAIAGPDTGHVARRESPRRQLDAVAVASAVAGLAQAAGESGADVVRGLRELSREAATALPRLARLSRIQPGTRISMALLLDELAARSPDAVAFLYEDRAHTHAAAKRRLDSVVAGLLSAGVRQGDHVGVLMATRPSAMIVVAALNRLGAVAVLMRPGQDTAREARLGAITSVIVDPEHSADARTLAVEVLVLGGGRTRRELPPGVVDMEQIDPAAVTAPSWYAPNPGRAGDMAFVLFADSGEATTAVPITNARWALSAFGTAAAGGLTDRDTLYTASPLHHSSALLMTLGGAIAGGSRLALSRGYDPETFWDEVGRYGVNVASYTWTMLRGLVDAELHPNERHHQLRLLLGSGMPPGLWERVAERLAPAQVVEFYASAKGEVVLVNLDGTKPGCVGRPLPGAAQARVVRWDLEADRLRPGPDGFAQLCPRGETGMLIGTVHAPGARGDILRSVFRPGDAWVSTGDLFRRDEDGDLWLVDPVSAVVPTLSGRVTTSAARDALGRLPSVDLAVAYGIRDGDGAHEQLAAAVTVRAGRTLTKADVARALRSLRPEERPALVHVVGEIPTTTSYRPDLNALRQVEVGRVVYGVGTSSA